MNDESHSKRINSNALAPAEGDGKEKIISTTRNDLYLTSNFKVFGATIKAFFVPFIGSLTRNLNLNTVLTT